MSSKLAVQETVRIWSHHNNLAVTFDDPSALGQNGLWVWNVFDHMIQGNGIERVVFKDSVFQRSAPDIEAAIDRRLNPDRVWFDAANGPAQFTHERKEVAITAAHI